MNCIENFVEEVYLDLFKFDFCNGQCLHAWLSDGPDGMEWNQSSENT